MRIPTLLVLSVCRLLHAQAEPEPARDWFRFPLIEFAPQYSSLQQTVPVGGVPTAFSSGGNPGFVVRLTPIWRGKYPLLFHMGGTQITEQNTAGLAVEGEHGNVKYVWTFGSRFAFEALDRVFVMVGMEFNHEPFLRDEGGGKVQLNKVLIPTANLGVSAEWWRSEAISATVDAGFKAYFSVPMDLYLVRNGTVAYGRIASRFRLNDLRVQTALFAESRALNTTLGDYSFQNFGFELAVGWGLGL